MRRKEPGKQKGKQDPDVHVWLFCTAGVTDMEYLIFIKI
jgi:hypothetical protein